MKDNKTKNPINNVINCINTEGANWIGLEMNFLYQQKVMTSGQLENLARSLNNLNNLSSLILSFGSLRVGLLHALNSKSAQQEFSKVLPIDMF